MLSSIQLVHYCLGVSRVCVHVLIFMLTPLAVVEAPATHTGGFHDIQQHWQTIDAEVAQQQTDSYALTWSLAPP